MSRDVGPPGGVRQIIGQMDIKSGHVRWCIAERYSYKIGIKQKGRKEERKKERKKERKESTKVS